jgi:hypothetical protein
VAEVAIISGELPGQRRGDRRLLRGDQHRVAAGIELGPQLDQRSIDDHLGAGVELRVEHVFDYTPNMLPCKSIGVSKIS